jgi:hypothetical protein
MESAIQGGGCMNSGVPEVKELSERLLNVFSEQASEWLSRFQALTQNRFLYQRCFPCFSGFAVFSRQSRIK